MGIVRDKREAKETSCTCHRISKDEIMCWSRGIVGTLSNSQEEKYCTEKTVWPITGDLKDRIEKFTEGIHAAEKRYEETGKKDINEWLDLVGEELEKRGIEA